MKKRVGTHNLEAMSLHCNAKQDLMNINYCSPQMNIALSEKRQKFQNEWRLALDPRHLDQLTALKVMLR